MNTRNLQIASNKMRDIERYFYSSLSHLYTEGEIRQFLFMLAEAILGWDTVSYLLHRNETINQSDLLKFHWAAEDLQKEKPIQQIIGWTTFCECRINVNEYTLIPRPETEEITERLISQMHTYTAPRILDLCTGSGCIAIALAHKFKEAQVIGIDISSEALRVANQNAQQNEAKVTFLCADILQGVPILPVTNFHLIVSNPPYIEKKERDLMSRNVLNYEPTSALFVDDNDPLLFYRSIALYAKSHLAKNGLLTFEINEKYGSEVCELLAQEGYTCQLIQDFRGKNRMVQASIGS